MVSACKWRRPAEDVFQQPARFKELLACQVSASAQHGGVEDGMWFAFQFGEERIQFGPAGLLQEELGQADPCWLEGG